MKVLVAGCGNIGTIAAQDLARSMSSVQVILADSLKERAKAAAERIGKQKTDWMQLDVTDHEKMIKALEDFDLVMGFLPGKLGYRFAETCIDAKKDLVDVSYMAENALTLNDKTLKADVTIVPDCGLAPGISNVLVGNASAKLDKINTIHVMVGGLPETPIPPLGYTITWSPESLVDEYTRKAGIIQKGKKVEVEALSGLEEIEFPKVGRLEAFYTDGLRTLLYTIGKVEDMWEKTLRYPGHSEKIRALRELGFFDEKQTNIDGISVSPRSLTVKLLGQNLWKPEVPDVVALRVEVSGSKGGKSKIYVYHLLDHYDRESGTTAMARTTAYPASIIAQLLLKKTVKERGIVSPEIIGSHEEHFKTFIEELGKRGVDITTERGEAQSSTLSIV